MGQSGLQNSPDSARHGGESLSAMSKGSGRSSLAPCPAVLEDLAFHPVSLIFRGGDGKVEGRYLAEVAASRLPIMIFIFVFDCVCYVMRFLARVMGGHDPLAVATGLAPQVLNMALLYVLMGLLNRRSRRSQSPRAAKQEEVLLALLMSVAISMLLLSLQPPQSRDYVYAAFFLICATPLLKIRWFVGTAVLLAPVLLAAGSHLRLHPGAAPVRALLGIAAPASGCDVAAGACAAAATAAAALPWEALVHLVVAWAVGGLMSFLSDSNRRQAFANHALALSAAEKELAEVRARAGVERELAAAQAQAAARALVVAREKASNEAKSEFMSLMCHEVRTPLNGCLASAEMLLETDLNAEQHDLARTIRVSGSILLSTVSNFLDFFKMEAGKQLDIVRTPLDVRDLVSDVHCIIEAMIGRDGVVALLEPDLSGVPSTVMGDPNRVCGILLNLYTNAAKFTKQGAIGLRVRVVGERYRPDADTAVRFLHSALGGASPRAGSSDDSGAATDGLATSLSSSAAGSDGEAAEDGSGVISAARRRSYHLPLAQPHQQPPAAWGAAGGGGGGRHQRREDDALQEEPGHSAEFQPRPSLQYESQWKSPSGGGSGGRGSKPGSRRASLGSKLATPGSRAGPASPAYGTAGFMRSSAEFDSAQSLPTAAELLAKEAEAEGVCSSQGGMELCHLGDGWTSVCSRPIVRQEAAAGASSASASGSEDGERRWLAFEVQDTGVGVASRGMDSLFQDYVQGTDLEMRRARSRGGTGLGLSICSKQVAVLGGQIGALSKPNCGSVFWFTIPLMVPPGTASAVAAAAAAAAVVPAQACGDAIAAAAVNISPRRTSGGQPRSSLEQELSELWGGGSAAAGGSAGSVNGSEGRNSMMVEQSSRGSGAEAGAATAPSSRRSNDSNAHTGHGNSFGWYHLPPAGGASRTAANRLRQPAGCSVPEDQPLPAGAAAGAAAHPGQQQAAAAALAAVSGQAKPAAVLHPHAHAGRGYGLWVLLVEDNLINQTVARKMLSALGMKCQVASNGREAVSAVQRAQESGMNFDVVLMDMCMPVLSGVDATKAIRQLGCTTPIVAMTANASERDRQECLSAGMNGFLSKPVLKDKLLDAIMTATEGAQ